MTPQNEEGWRATVTKMTEGGPDRRPLVRNVPERHREEIIEYLAKNFGPDKPRRKLKLDTLEIDEDEVANAIYIEYELPAPAEGMRQMHDPYIAPDGSVWYSDTGVGSVWLLDPETRDPQKRIKQEFQVKNPLGRPFVRGITVNSKGVVYCADRRGGYLGEVDPTVGEVKIYERLPGSAILQVVVDSQDNVWFNLYHGNKIGRFDAKTAKVSLWEIPMDLAEPYGLVVDQMGRVWSAGIGRDVIIKFDPATETFNEYPTSTHPSGPRRLGVDANGKIWWAEYFGGHLGMLDPETGKMVGYPFPLRFSAGYDAWPIGDDVWITEGIHQTMVQFNQKTKKFTYYPLPLKQRGLGVPKIEVDKASTIWFGYRGTPNNPAVAFKPRGNPEPEPSRVIK
jgi:streptogramin lyase